MILRRLFLFALAPVLAAASAFAADLPTLPSLASDPQMPAPDWKGFYVGSGVMAGFAKGSKGQFGGDVFAGYDHHFDNGLILGARFDTGYNPWLTPYGRFQGFDFAATSIKLGYEMGRFTPYVTTGVALTKGASFTGGPPSAASSVNALFYGPGAVQAVGVAGAGFDYAVTNNLHVGVGVNFYGGAGGVAP